MNLQAPSVRLDNFFTKYITNNREALKGELFNGSKFTLMHLNPLSLSFPPDLEKAFLDDYFNKSLKQVRLTLLLGIFFYGIFGILDAKLMPDTKETLWFIRYAVITPSILSVIFFSYFKVFRSYMQACLTIVITISGLGIIIMIAIAPPPINYSYYAGLILVLIFGYVFLRIRFIWATVAGWVIVLFYEIAAVWINETPFTILFNNNFFFISANFIGMFACYSIEYYSRRDFYMACLLELEQEKVQAANLELEKRVEERTAQLKSANKELTREIKAHKRAEEEKRDLETQLRQAQKMEAIGTLAGGIAHDFNNILSPIIGYSEMLLEDAPKNKNITDKLEQIQMAATRAKELVSHILTFSRQSEQELTTLEIQPVIKEALKLLRASLPSTIEIKQNIDTNCGPVLADPTQIHQIVINLCTNAFHAMREEGGVLGVELAKEDISSSDLIYKLNLNPGPHAKLTFSDTGHGMERSVQDRIFDPYFTTKAPGEGTGLGLAVVHGIVKSYGGDIKIYSEFGKGTTFHVYLPCIESEVSEKGSPRIGSARKGHEHVLMIDDEKYIVTMMKEMLERLGYQVTSFTNSVEAFEEFRRKPNRFDVVITDQTMPNKTGSELAEEIMRVRPEIPVILCTGFSEILSEEKARSIGIKEYITKPVVKSEISRALRKVLD
jgi:signal transduction histidine kinase/CheY-like chemotaxis protein